MFNSLASRLRRILPVALAVLVTSCGARSTITPPVQPSPTPLPAAETSVGIVSQIDTYVNGLVDDGTFSGSVLVAQNGEVVLTEGYGLADREQNRPNTPQTKFRLASITKQFTAMAVLILQEQGKLHVQDPICQYLSLCPAAWEAITIHHLLTHTSGIPSFTSFPDYVTSRATPSSPGQTFERFKDMPLDFQPGEKWSYSNSGYIVLGLIIEQASGESYEMFLHHNIFVPLQMTNSGYDHNDGSLAIGYTTVYGQLRTAPYIDMSIPYAAGGLYATVEDMYRWDQALYTEQLVSRDLLELMFTPHVRMTDGSSSYGYGWTISEMNNHQAIGHWGGIEGFATLFVRFPEDKLTIIVLSNRDTANVGDVLDVIVRVLFEG
jgi:CubicO group peptidase (beta-lactamase class C family)